MPSSRSGPAVKGGPTGPSEASREAVPLTAGSGGYEGGAPGNNEMRDLIDREPALVYAWQTGNARFVTDLDTREDLERLASLTGWRIELSPQAEATPV